MEKFNHLLSKHPRTSDKIINYGTAGFRDKATELDHIMFRMGILAALRSRKMKAAIGVMITASHNPEADNGLKLIDPRGEMLEAVWESIATNIANVKDEDLERTVNEIIESHMIDIQLEANVYLGRDTRSSSARFAKAVSDGISAVNGTIYNFDLLTTPQLHYIVLCQNSAKAYGEPTEEGYYQKISNAFISLNGENGAEKIHRNYLPSVVVDGANGVGAVKLKQMMAFLRNSINITLHNSPGDGILNHECGADYVKVQQRPPKIFNTLEPEKRYLSFDGDADRIIYFYQNSCDGKFHMLDGDKIAVLFAAYLKQLLVKAQLSQLELCIVQTAYANGSSTLYIEEVLQVPVSCVPTGVKHLHHRAQMSDIGVYFEANGHGTIVFSEKAKRVIKEASSSNEYAKTLLILIDMINETVGDAISDMLIVETILRSRGESAEDWDNLYTDLPNRLLKVNVTDRNVITTGDAERKCLTPQGLQKAIDDLIAKYGGKSRSFVRPSGTEDVVRVYAEAINQEKADALAKDVANVVFDLAGGVGTKY